MRPLKVFGIGLTTLILVGICNAIALPDTIGRSLIPTSQELPRNQPVILDWTQMTGDPAGAAGYVVNPDRATLSKWAQFTSISQRLGSQGGHTTTAKLSGSLQSQKILFAKSLIGLDGSVTSLKIPDKGQDSVGNGTSRSHNLSPDGDTVAYIDDRDGERKRGAFDEIYLFDLKTGQSRQVTRLGQGRIDALVWSLDSKSLAFMRQGMLYRTNLDSNDLQELHQFAFRPPDSTQPQPSNEVLIQPESSMRWSRDGRTIALLGSKDSDRMTTIWLFDVQTKQLRALFPAPPARFKGGIEYPFDIDDFDWSPDGQQIVLSAGWGSEARSCWGLYNLSRHFLYRVNITEGKLIQLTHTPQSGARLLWVQSP